MRFEGNCRYNGVVLTWEPVGKWRKMRLEVCDVLRTLSCVLKSRKQAGDIRPTFYKPFCGSSVEDEGVRPDTRSLI